MSVSPAERGKSCPRNRTGCRRYSGGTNFLESHNAKLAAERGTDKEKLAIMDCLSGIKAESLLA